MSFGTPETLSLNAQQQEAKRVRVQRDKTSLLSGQSADAFATSFGEVNVLNRMTKGIVSTANDFYAYDDKQFQELNTVEMQEKIAAENGLSKVDAFRIGEAKNSTHRDKIVHTLIEDKEAKKQAYEYGSNFVRGAGAITGSLLDIDVVVGGVAGLMAKSYRTAMVFDAAAEIISAGVRLQVDDNYKTSDAAVDIGAGLLIGSVVYKAMGIPSKNDFENVKQFIPENQPTLQVGYYPIVKNMNKDGNIVLPDGRIVSPQSKEATDLARKDNELKAFQANVELGKRRSEYRHDTDEFMEWYKTEQKNTQLELDTKRKEIADDTEYDSLKREEEYQLEKKIKELKSKEEELTNKKNDDFLRQEEERLEREYQLEVNTEIAKKFESPKYEGSVIKSTLRNIAKEGRAKLEIAKKSKLKSEKIVLIKQTIRSTEDSLSVLNKKIKGGHNNKGVLTKWNNQRDNLVNKINQEKNKLSNDINSHKRTMEARELNRLLKEVDDIADTTNEAISILSKEIRTMDSSSVLEIKDSVDLLSKNNPEFNKLKSEIGNVLNKKNGKINLNGLSNKKKVAILSVLGASSLMASDEDGALGASTIALMAIASIAFAPSVIRTIRDKKVIESLSVFKMSHSDNVKASKYANSKNGKGFLSLIGETTNYFNSRFNSTLQEIRNYGNKDVDEFIRDFLYDPLDASKKSMDAEKMQVVRGEQAKVASALNEGFVDYIDELEAAGKQGIGFLDNAKNRKAFNKEVSNILDGIPSASKGASHAAKKIRNVMDNTISYAKQVGVKGANDVELDKDYLPRLWDFDNLRKLISTNESDVVNNFKRMLVGQDNPTEMAEKMVDWFKNTKNTEGGDSEDIFNRLKEHLKEGVTELDIAESLATEADKASRLKNRLDMDLTKWTPINGVELDSIVNRDISSIMDSYLNQMYGQIGLAQRSFKTEKMFRDHIDKISSGSDIRLNTALHEMADLILGKAVKQSDPMIHEFVQTAKALTFAVALPLVALSMVPEMIKTVSRVGLPMTMRHLTGSFSTMNKNSHLFKSLTELTGQGTHSIRQKLDFKGLDTADLGEQASLSAISQASIRLQEATARYSGLVKFSDVFQKLNLVKSATDIANIVSGGKHGLPKSRLDVYGIDDKFMKEFKDDFSFTNGELDAVDSSKWSYDKRAKYNDVIFRIGQDYTPEVVLGTVGKWSRNSEIGRLMSFLISYPMNLFSNQGIRDANIRDSVAISNNIMTFAGTYIGLVARAELEGREYDHEQIVKYSLMNLPQVAQASTIRSFLDPSISQHLRKAKESIDSIASKTIEEF